MAGVVREPVDIRKTALQPAGEEVDGQRKAVHFRKQCDQKRAERAERAPVPTRPRLKKAVGK